jgi:small subunit ribosomal protein S2
MSEEQNETTAEAPAEAPITATPEQDGRRADFEVPEQGAASPVAETAVRAGERAIAEASGDFKAEARDPSDPVNVRELFEAGVHFGHQTRRWNPKMKPYIYGARQGIHIIDLDQTAKLAQTACRFIADAVGRGGNVLFVGTKRQAQEIIRGEAERSGMFYVTNRWLGGTLTNFRTMKTGLDRLRNLERMAEDGTYDQLLKKETVKLDKERARLEKHIGGMKGMTGIPQVMFIVDPAQETIAVKEARKLGIKIVAITDTNCDPGLVDFVIPGNDDAIRSIRLITSALADACLHGVARRRDNKDGGKGASVAPSGPAAEVIYSGRPKA